MTEKLHRRKAILLLLGISIFAIFVVNKTRNFNVRDIQSTEYVVSEKTESPVEEKELIQNTYFIVDDELNPIKEVYPEFVLNEKEILGAQNCRTPEFIYSTEKICSTDPSSFGYSEEKQARALSVGEIIRRDDVIRLETIKVPPLINGSETMDSSVRQIRSKDKTKDGLDRWTLKPDGEMINREIVQGNAYPGDIRTKELIEQAEESKQQPYGLTYYFQGGETAEPEGKDEVIIDKYMENDCDVEACRNYSNPTPEKFLNLSSVLAQSKNTPGQYREDNAGDNYKGIEECEDNTTFINMQLDGTKELGCISLLEKISLTLKKIINSIGDADACSSVTGSGQDSVLGTPCNEDANYYYYTDEKGLCSIQRAKDDCVNTASIVVIMESPWGTGGKCGRGSDAPCVTEYNELRNGDYNTPGGEGTGNVYLLTDCTAFIEGIAKTVDLKCAWDINHVAKELEFQSFDNIPNEEYPETDEYLKFQVEKAEVREDEPIPM